jgi:hypothetical protein
MHMQINKIQKTSLAKVQTAISHREATILSTYPLPQLAAYKMFTIFSDFGLMIEFTRLFDTACVYTLQFTITHTLTSVHSYVFSKHCSVVVSNSRCSPSSGFPNYPQPQLPVFHRNRSQ